MASEHVVYVSLIQSIQTEAKIIKVWVHGVFGPEQVHAVEGSIQGHDKVRNVLLRQEF